MLSVKENDLSAEKIATIHNITVLSIFWMNCVVLIYNSDINCDAFVIY